MGSRNRRTGRAISVDLLIVVRREDAGLREVVKSDIESGGGVYHEE